MTEWQTGQKKYAPPIFDHGGIKTSVIFFLTSQGIFIWNIKALSLTVQKLLARLQFSKNGSNSNVTG